MDGVELVNKYSTASTTRYEQVMKRDECGAAYLSHEATIEWKSAFADKKPVPNRITVTIGGLTYTYEVVGFRVGA